MISYLATGTLLGFSAGFTPGPLLTLIVTETLRHNLKAGIKVALAPVLTDLPIVVLTLFILAKLSHFHTILGIISFLGGLFILRLGYENMCMESVNISLDDAKEQSLRKGMIVNLLNPHPYLFWFTVGAPTTIKAIGQSVFAAMAFVGSFYVLLVGSKIAVAILVGRSRSFLAGSPYLYIMRFLGAVLFILAFFLFYDGLKLLGILK